MTYDNIKSRKMPGLHPLFRYFKKPPGGNKDDPPPPSPPAVLGLDNCFLCLYIRNEKMLKYNVKFNFEDMVHMPNFLKHLGSWSCFVLHLLISLLWLTDYEGSL